MDRLDRAFLAVFRSRPSIARHIRRYGVVRFRRQLRQAARLVDYPLSGGDEFRLFGYTENLIDNIVARAGR